MSRDPPANPWRAWRLAWMGLALALLLVAGLSPLLAPHAHGPGSPGGAGTGELLAAAEATGYEAWTTALGPATVEALPPGQTVLVLIEPGVPLMPGEVGWLERWVEDGGGLLVADGSAATASLATELGLEVRQRRIFDASLSNQDPSTVPITSISGHEGALEAPTVIASLDEASSWGPWLSSGNRSFLDVDGDGELGPSDTRGPFLVGARHGEDRVLWVTSASLVVDDGLADAGNQAIVAAALQDLLPAGGNVVLDTGHGPRGPVAAGVQSVGLGVQSAGQAWWAGGLLAVLAGILALASLSLLEGKQRLVPWSQSDQQDPAEMAADTEPMVDAKHMKRELTIVAEEARGRPRGFEDRRRAIEAALAKAPAREE